MTVWQFIVLLGISLFWITSCAEKKPVAQANYKQYHHSLPAISIKNAGVPSDVYQTLFKKIAKSEVFEATYAESQIQYTPYQVSFVYRDSQNSENQDKASVFNNTQFSLAPVKNMIVAELDAVIYKDGQEIKTYHFKSERNRKSSGFTKVKDDRTDLINRLGQKFLQTVTQDGVFGL